MAFVVLLAFLGKMFLDFYKSKLSPHLCLSIFSCIHITQLSSHVREITATAATMQFKTLIALLAFATAVSAACESKYSGTSTKLLQTGDKMNGTDLNVSGTVTVINGCSFSVAKFTYLPGSNDTAWYGRLNGEFTVSFPVSDTIVPAMKGSTSPTYTLDPSITWDKLDTLILYSRDNKLQVGYARFNFAENANATVTTTSSATSTATATSTSAAATFSSTLTPHIDNGTANGAMSLGESNGNFVLNLIFVAVGMFLLV